MVTQLRINLLVPCDLLPNQHSQEPIRLQFWKVYEQGTRFVLKSICRIGQPIVFANLVLGTPGHRNSKVLFT